MQKTLLILIVLALVGYSAFFFFKSVKQQVKKDLASPISYPTATIVPSIPKSAVIKTKEKNSLFVPYWGLKDKITEATYDQYLYFGVAPTKSGLDFKEAGTVALNRFASLVPNNSKKLLVIRMIDSDTNFAVLKDVSKQKTIISQAITVAQDNGFDGLVLDLEVSAIPFESLVNQINGFTKLFYSETKKKKLSFAVTVYGDVFYRVRPFDVKTLANNSDQIMIMAYDFSKAKGNPGPNFPLHGAQSYGYDYEKMIDDFLRVVPAKKITVVFGMFGYDWLVDNKGRTLEQGKAVALHEVQSNFIEACQQKSCSFSRDDAAFETRVDYVHKNGSKHIIWFEDSESVAAKKNYLKQRGINSFSFWAYSYF